ncbi:MAG: hypothetical protein HQM00_13760 [Magnetococcales bacterium]|nr:hypothetical protein [Magnetococcales bacterium]
MKNLPVEWPLLTRPLVLFSGALLLGIGMVIGAWAYRDDAGTTLEKLRKSIQTLRSQRQQQEEMNRILIDIQPKHEELKQRGVIGAEPRLHWIETIKAAKPALKLPTPIRFKLEPARAYTPEFPLPASPDYQLMASHMELGLGLVHEGDLMSLIEFLEKSKAGLIRFTQCKVTVSNPQKPDANPFSKPQVNLTGTCQLEWFNFRETENRSR